MTTKEISSGEPMRFDALQLEYDHLRKASEATQTASHENSPSFESICDLAQRIVAAGAYLAEPDERRRAQTMLNYCSARLFALAPNDQNVKVRLIEPYAGAPSEAHLNQHSPPASLPKQEAKTEDKSEGDEKNPHAIDGTSAETEGRSNSRSEQKDSPAREQVRLKAMARQWRISKSNSYLLSGHALKMAEAFWGRDPEITAFVSASRQKVESDRTVHRLYVAMTLLLLAIVGTGWWWVPLIAHPFQVFLTREPVAEIAGAGPCNENRDAGYAVVDLKKLLALQTLSTWKISGRMSGTRVCDLILTNQSLEFPLDLSGADVKWPYFQRIKGRQPSAPAKVDMSYSIIENGRFLGAVLTEANFFNCTLLSSEAPSDHSSHHTSFKGASLERADFRGCQIENVSFSSANLRDADFTGASILGDTDFIGANLTGAIFAETAIEKPLFTDADLTYTDFRGSSLKSMIDSQNTTWWLAIWSGPLNPSQYRRGDAMKGNRYVDETIELDLMVELAEARFNSYQSDLNGREVDSGRIIAFNERRATALNEWAWHHAVYGLELEKAAEFARKAQEITLSVSGNEDPRINDTIGYISLQLGRLNEARTAYEFIETKRAAGSLSTVEPGSRHRYALVLAGLNMCAEAEEVAASVLDQKPTYAATHERVLVPAATPKRCPAMSSYFGLMH